MTLFDATDAAIVAMWDDGLSVPEIASALNIGEPHVETIVAEAGEPIDHVPFSRWISSEDWGTEA